MPSALNNAELWHTRATQTKAKARSDDISSANRQRLLKVAEEKIAARAERLEFDTDEETMAARPHLGLRRGNWR